MDYEVLQAIAWGTVYLAMFPIVSVLASVLRGPRPLGKDGNRILGIYHETFFGERRNGTDRRTTDRPNERRNVR